MAELTIVPDGRSPALVLFSGGRLVVLLAALLSCGSFQQACGVKTVKFRGGLLRVVKKQPPWAPLANNELQNLSTVPRSRPGELAGFRLVAKPPEAPVPWELLNSSSGSSAAEMLHHTRVVHKEEEAFRGSNNRTAAAPLAASALDLLKQGPSWSLGTGLVVPDFFGEERPAAPGTPAAAALPGILKNSSGTDNSTTSEDGGSVVVKKSFFDSMPSPASNEQPAVPLEEGSDNGTYAVSFRVSWQAAAPSSTLLAGWPRSSQVDRRSPDGVVVSFALLLSSALFAIGLVLAYTILGRNSGAPSGPPARPRAFGAGR